MLAYSPNIKICMFSVNNYTIPAESEVVIGLNLVHRDPLYWEYPNSFYPDHFLPEAESLRPKYAFLPFGGGPRKCPGNITLWGSILPS